MLSTETRAELLGPVWREGQALPQWIAAFARRDAATLGTLESGAQDDVTTGTIAGQRMILAALSVRTPAGTRYVAYAVRQDTPPDAPVIVVRSVFGDALTVVRVFRSSVEALMPYVLTPMERMQAPRAVAMDAPPDTTFRGSGNAASTSTVVSDSSDRAVISAFITDALADLERSPMTEPTRAPSSAARTPDGRNGAASPSTAASSLATSLVKVVFYQFGDLQYHPVALFRDGTSYDVLDVPLERTDAAASRVAHPRRWGRWRNEGPTYYLAEPGERERDYTLGGGGFHTAFAAPQGTTLTGNYKAVSGMIMGETSTLSTTQLRFASDGRFTRGTDFAAIGSGEQSGVRTAAGASRSNAGRYRVSGHRLVLTFDDGEMREYFFAFGSGGAPERLDPDMIFVGATAFVRDDP
jgi:hypothetical protein